MVRELRNFTEADPSLQYKFVKPLPIRPGFNTTGKQLNVRVNQYKVLDWPQKRIHQYDVNVSLPLFQKLNMS